MKKLLLTILALIIVAGIAKTVFASYDRLPEPMVGQTTARQGTTDYYGGFTGNEAVYNHTNDTDNPSGPSGQSTFTKSSVSAPVKQWIAMGLAGNFLATSPDGTTWTSRALNLFSFGSDIAWNGTKWVAVGSPSGSAPTNNSLITSSNGINWTAGGVPFGSTSNSGYGVAWNGKMWVAVGNGTNGATPIIYSTDINAAPANWIKADSSRAVFGGPNSEVRGIAWNGRLWVAVGYGDSCAAAYSYDGINWIASGTPYPFGGAGYGYDVAWNGYGWVAVGRGAGRGPASIAYSSDGISWTKIASSTSLFSSANSVAWNDKDKMWVIVGEGAFSIAYSRNLAGSTGTWIGIPNGAHPNEFHLGNKISWDGTTWVAVGGDTGGGEDNSIMSSTDGINWVGRDHGGGIFNEAGHAVAVNQDTLVDGTTAINHEGYDLFGFEKNSLIDANAGCIKDIVFQETTNRCFFSNSKNTNVKVMSSRTYVNADPNKKPVMEMAVLYYPPLATIVGDAYLGVTDLDDFAYWGRSLVTTNGSVGLDGNQTFWGLTNYPNGPLAQANLSAGGTEWPKYVDKVKEMAGEAAPVLAGELGMTTWRLQGSTFNGGANDEADKYPQGKVWHHDAEKNNPITLAQNTTYTYYGKGTIIFHDKDVNPGPGLKFNNGARLVPGDANSQLGIIMMDTNNITFEGNNKVQAAILCYSGPGATGGSFIFNGGNIDFIGSFVMGSLTSLKSNIRFYYDKKLDSMWPPGFRYLNMPHPTEN